MRGFRVSVGGRGSWGDLFGKKGQAVFSVVASRRRAQHGDSLQTRGSSIIGSGLTASVVDDLAGVITFWEQGKPH